MPGLIDINLCSQIEILLSDKKQMRKYRNYVARMLEDKTKYSFARPYLPEDIIYAVKEKLLIQKYHWNNQSCSLKTFFWFRLRTYCYNLINHEINFRPVKINEFDSNDDDNNEDESNVYSPEVMTPEEFIIQPNFDFIDNEDENFIDPLQFTLIAFELFKDSPEEFCVLDEMYKGFKPRFIALHLGLKVTEVYNIQQRIKRAIIHKLNHPD